MAKNVGYAHGFIRAVADQTHPLQTRLSIILTDFHPNNNKQGVPKSEAENIIRTALHTPLKINFDGVSYAGHKGAIPIGPITNVYYAEDNGREVIAGDAIVWNDIYEDVADHLKVAFAEGIGTSWEIYFKESETDDSGIEWLQGCVFAGTCVVETPAYGPNRTRILAIAETLNERANALENVNMANELETDRDQSTANGAAATSADDVTTLRTDISNVLDTLGGIYTGLYNMLDDTYELEASLVTDDMPGMAEQLTKLLASITKRFDALKEKAGVAETALAELKELKDTIAAAEIAKAEAEKLSTRTQILKDVGIEITPEKTEFYVTMSEEMFNHFVEDLKTARGNKTVAEKKPVIPNPINDGTSTVTVKDIAAEWDKHVSNR